MADSWKQASIDLVWDTLDDVQPAADTESAGVVIIIGSEVLSFDFKKFLTSSWSSNLFFFFFLYNIITQGMKTNKPN